MNVSLVFVVLFGLVAASLGDFVVIDTYAEDDMYCNTTHIARFYTNNGVRCIKRAVLEPEPCTNYYLGSGYINYVEDYSYCFSETGPAELEGWQSVKLTSDPNCNVTETPYSVYSAPQSIQNKYVVIFHPLIEVTPFNVSFSCDSNLGVQSFSTCSLSACDNYTLANNVCTIGTDNTTDISYARQTTCTVVPVAIPMPVPTGEPTSVPGATPTKTPIKAPGTKTSAASILYGSVAFFALITLL